MTKLFANSDEFFSFAATIADLYCRQSKKFTISAQIMKDVVRDHKKAFGYLLQAQLDSLMNEWVDAVLK
jgi:hypothetical protein